MGRYKCNVCGYIYNEDEKGVKWEDLPNWGSHHGKHAWICIACGATKEKFSKIG